MNNTDNVSEELQGIIVGFKRPDERQVLQELRREQPAAFADLPAEYVIPDGRLTRLSDRDRRARSAVTQHHTGECRRKLFGVLQEIGIRDEQVQNLGNLGLLTICSLTAQQRRHAKALLLKQDFIFTVADDGPIELIPLSETTMPHEWREEAGVLMRPFVCGDAARARTICQSILSVAQKFKLDDAITIGDNMIALRPKNSDGISENYLILMEEVENIVRMAA